MSGALEEQIMDVIFTEATRIVLEYTDDETVQRVAAIMSMCSKRLAERVAAELPEVSETQKLLAVWTEGLVTDKEAYWRLREIAKLRAYYQPQDSKCPPPPPHTDSDSWSIYGRPE